MISFFFYFCRGDLFGFGISWPWGFVEKRRKMAERMHVGKKRGKEILHLIAIHEEERRGQQSQAKREIEWEIDNR